MSAAEIRAATPSWTDVDDHAVEMAVSRLRRLLGDPQIVQTIIKRGYRLARLDASRLQNRYLETRWKPLDSPDGQGLHETTDRPNSNRAV